MGRFNWCEENLGFQIIFIPKRQNSLNQQAENGIRSYDWNEEWKNSNKSLDNFVFNTKRSQKQNSCIDACWHVSQIHSHLYFLTISPNGAVLEYIKIWDFIKLVAFSDSMRGSFSAYRKIVAYY